MLAEPDPYLLPGTACLKNKLGLTDVAELRVAEAEIVALADFGVARRPLPGKYDLRHLQLFHKTLFGQVYPWAGTLRSTELSKGPTNFIPRSRLTVGAASLLDPLYEDKGMLLGYRRDAMLAELTVLLSGLNALHPFREGNGRTQRAFLRQLAAAAGWRLNWSGLDPAANVAASIESVRGSDEPLQVLLDQCLSRLGGSLTA